jgi:hypothetical protein
MARSLSTLTESFANLSARQFLIWKLNQGILQDAGRTHFLVHAEGSWKLSFSRLTVRETLEKVY